MAELIENKKGFKVIKVSLLEVREKFKGFGICDRCNDAFFDFMYIPVLHSCYCQQCFNEWIEKAINYKEDHFFEERAFQNAKTLLNLNTNEKT